jgi:serine protease Do/2-alkenal reductase
MNLPLRLLCAALFFAGTSARAESMLPPLADLAARVMPSVVSIASTDPVNASAPADSDSGSDGDNDDNGDGGGDGSAYHATADTGTVIPPPKAEEALGSGFIFDPAGYVLTNNHVIDGAGSVSVTLQDGTILPATIVGRDKAADLAVLKIDAGHPLPAVSFGDSGKLRVGDWVLAIGNPFGLPGSTSAGIVSALDRNINSGNFDDFIQTDATINRGNSGGPLFDTNGNVIGVNSAIYSPSGASDGIGFAIPAAMAAPVAEALKATGNMTRGWLGAATQEVTPAIQQSLGLPDTSGALIGAISPGSPAAGKMQAGDVVVSLSGVPVKNPRALLVRTAEIPAGQKAAVTFWRDGAAQQATLLITVPPASLNDAIVTPAAAPAAPANIDLTGLGLAVSAAPASGGVSVTAATGPSARAGIVAGDVIEQVAGQNIATAADLQSQVQRLAQSHQAAATLLVSGDAPDGTDPGPRWVPVPFKK